jgi:hypothetical protein
MSELADRRYLGALRFVDVASGAAVRAPLEVVSEQARFFANRSNLYVIAAADGLTAHLDAFEAPPASPPPGAFEIEGLVADPAELFLPRRFRVSLPRVPSSGDPASLYAPIDVALYPSSRGRAEGNWAEVRASLRTEDDARASGAFARVVRESDGATLGRGMSEPSFDRRRPERPRSTAGELLVFVPGIPVTLWGDPGEPVLVHEVAVRLEVAFDPDAGAIPDPDVLEDLPVPVENRWSFALAAGRVHGAGLLEVIAS